MRLISVEPLGDGWTVKLDPFANDMVFLSGLEAEKAARQLGPRIADAGHPVELRIFVPRGALAGRFSFVPAPSVFQRQAADRAPAETAGRPPKRNSKHAIRVGPNERGWMWELIDTESVTTAKGFAVHQDAAMGSAWRTAESSASTGSDGSSDIDFSRADSARTAKRSSRC